MSRSNIVLLVDWSASGDSFWLADLLEDRGFRVLTVGIPDYSMRNRQVKWRKVLLWWQYAVLGYRGAQLARQTDSIVVAWNFIAGVFAVIVSQLFPQPRGSVVSLNAIAFSKGVIHNLARGFVYRRAFASGRLWLTVNSEALRELYGQWFGFSQSRVEVLHDCWTEDCKVGDPGMDDEGYVFVGGEAARDWPLVLEIAKQCPDVRFEVVARRKDWPSTHMCPLNVHLRFDISEEDFYGFVEGSRLVLVPLNSTVTAGLIVLLRAALLGRVVLATRTPATEACYPRELRHLLVEMGDVAGYCAQIESLWQNDDARVSAARLLQGYVYASRSPDGFADRVAQLVRRTAD
jgi:hypothetical protein